MDEISEETPWTCPSCSQKVSCIIKHKIAKTSRYLIIHLNRYLNANSKNSQRISIENEIEIDGLKYNLSAVTCHSGTLNQGHYYSYCMRENGIYKFNDSNFSRSDFSSLINSETPYLLFYSISK